jgi:transcriptional regulator with XRE-family HTH domain
MNDVRELIAQLIANGWTGAAIADELGVAANTVSRWHLGTRDPTNARAVKVALEQLLQRKRIPKRKRYKEKEPST